MQASVRTTVGLQSSSRSHRHRFAGMAAVMFNDVDRAVREIRWAHANGFRGVVLPVTPHEAQLYDVRYEPIWNTLEDLGMVLNSHVSLSAEVPAAPPSPHLTATAAIFGIDAFLAVQRVLRVLIWGGVLDRHPNLKVVFTEQHSDWVVPMLAKMDFSYIAGDLRKDIHSSVRLKPSEYWQRQCYLGSSIFSRAEIRARRSIGIDKMMLGFDYPHFEGAWRLGVRDYIQATLGEQEVSEDEAQLMLSKTAAEVFRFDVDELRSVADRIGPEPESVLDPVGRTARRGLCRPRPPTRGHRLLTSRSKRVALRAGQRMTVCCTRPDRAQSACVPRNSGVLEACAR